MEDRFDRTQREAVAAIDRAKDRLAAARDRRRDLELRIAELAHPHPPHRPQVEVEHRYLAEARDRAAQAVASSERAKLRASDAEARRQSA